MSNTIERCAVCQQLFAGPECPVCAPAPLTNRQKFIRAHASALDAARVVGLSAAGREPTIWSARESWDLAKQLWDAKPEDC